ncbi:MAG: exosome complex exonuclease Rrp41 [Candidatus Heimdallarchaeota archaeon]|nr:exosome complex exonuclease Rrp41 [Candidatus Heimdallarchaeota archaeon]
MSNEFKRPDGRKVDEMRNVEVEVGILNRADGSAKAILGNNMAIASVYGPREMHPKHASRPDRAVIRLNYRMATFSVKDYKRPFPSRREKEISKVLSEAFESIVLTKMFPRSVIDVHVQIFESDGGTRTAAAIAASAALADAGIPMRDLTGGIASGLYEDTVCLDLNGWEDNVGSGDMPIVYSPNIDEISLFQLDGLFTFEQFKKSYNYSLEGISSIVDIIQSALKQKYVKVRDELALEDDEEEVETQYSSNEEDQEVPTSKVKVVESESVHTSMDTEIKGENGEGETTPETQTITETEPEVPTQEVAEESKTVSEMLAEEEGEKVVDEEASDSEDSSEFDRSGLKPMGGIIQKIASSEEDEDDSSEESEDNLKDLYKKIKDDDEQESSNDIMRDIEYSDMAEDN